jgi:hypothetical protein
MVPNVNRLHLEMLIAHMLNATPAVVFAALLKKPEELLTYNVAFDIAF